VREHAGDKETAWASCGQKPGLEIWRIEQFKVVALPQKRYGQFYDGDSYIVLHTYKKKPDSEELFYDLHFWLGEDTTQDEAGTAAYKTVELDDHLHGSPVQYREVQGFESPRFLSYFPHFTCQKGGVATGFHHVSQAPPPDVHRLYHITSPFTSAAHAKIVVVREVAPNAQSLRYGDVFVLDQGTTVLQFNMKGSSGKERFKAADFVRSIADHRVEESKVKCTVQVFEEGAPGAGTFLKGIGASADQLPHAPPSEESAGEPHLHKLSDAEGSLSVVDVPAAQSSLSSDDVFVLDVPTPPTVYVWIGKGASDRERKVAVHLGQKYLHDREGAQKATSVVRVTEGAEPQAFFAAFHSQA